MKNPTITDKKIKTRLIEPLLDFLEDGVIVHDENRIIYLVNKAITQITGLSKEEIIGKDCHSVFKSNGLCNEECAFLNGPSIKSTCKRELNLVYEKKDKTKLRLSLKSVPIKIAGEKKGVLAIIKDITNLFENRWSFKNGSFHGLIGNSEKIKKVFDSIVAVSAFDYPVLITGESGTGKELVAKALHKESNRKNGPFIAVNCAAIPETILESELFGHFKGAFTGAIKNKKGRFELAQGGTLFLDEIGDLPITMQAKLLRVLQEKTFEPLGSETTFKADVRIITATNKDLRDMVERGSFREDLYYRLCVVPIDLPPLRERSEDILPIATNILISLALELKDTPLELSPRASFVVNNYYWPGNVRELINALQYACVHCKDQIIQTRHLPHQVLENFNPPEPEKTSKLKIVHPVLKQKNELSLKEIQTAIESQRGNKAKAAKKLGISRATLYRILNKDKKATHQAC